MNKLAHKHSAAQQRKDLNKSWEDDKGVCKAYWSMAFILSAVLWVGFGKLMGWY